MTKSLVLVLDTSSSYCSIGLANQTGLINSRVVKACKGHTEVFFPLLIKLLKESRYELSEIEGFGVCTGPGNFTGLRISISAARAFSLSCNKPAIGVSAFEILNDNSRSSLVLIEGRGTHFYGQEFSGINKIGVPKILSLDTLSNFDFQPSLFVIGYKADEVASSIGSRKSYTTTNLDLGKLAALTISRLGKKNPRPTPLYIK